MAYLALEFQDKIGIELNELLHKKGNRNIVLTGPRYAGKKFIAEHLETDVAKLPIIPEFNHLFDFIVYLQSLQTGKVGLSGAGTFISTGSKISVGGSFVRMLKCVIDKFAPNFDKPIQKAVKILKKLAGISDVVLFVCVGKDADEEYCDALTHLTEAFEGNIKVVFIINAADLSYLKSRGKFFGYKALKVEPEEKDLRTCFENILDNDKINELIGLANGNVGCFAGLFEYITGNGLSSAPNYNFNGLFEAKIEALQNNEPDAICLADFLSFFENDFTRREIEYVYEILDTESKVSKRLNPLIKTLLDEKLLSENELIYKFLLSAIKDLLRIRNEEKKSQYYEKVETCISRFYPLDYESRYFYAMSSDNRNRADEILFAWNLHLLKSETFCDTSVKFDYGDTELNLITKKFVKSYSEYYLCNYEECGKILKDYICNRRAYVKNEAKYLFALCLWKLSRTKSSAVKYFEDVAEDKTAEWETRIMAKLCLISAYANNAQYIDNALTKAKKYFKEINGEADENDLNYSVIINVLKRKAVAIFDTAEAEPYLTAAYEYFNTNPPIFESEYIMAACNLAADKLTLGKFEEAVCILDKAKESGFANEVQSVYLDNNRFVTKYFIGSITEKEVLDYVERFKSPSEISADLKTMTYSNFGALLLGFDNSQGEKLLFEADSLNGNCDDYYAYHIYTNLAVYYLLNKNLKKAATFARKSNFVPKLFKPVDAQYILFRNRVLNEIIDETGETATDLNALTEIFRRRFRERFILEYSEFFSGPYLFSDVQFWTEN